MKEGIRQKVAQKSLNWHEIIKHNAACSSLIESYFNIESEERMEICYPIYVR